VGTLKIGLIRVLTLTDQREIDRHGSIIERVFSGLKVTSCCIEDHPKGLYDKVSEEAAKPKIIGLAKKLEEGVEAIIVSCVADPAIVELKEMLTIPVIGAGQSLAAVSRTLGDTIGVVTISNEVPGAVARGLQDHCLAWAKVKGVENTLDLKEGDIVGRAASAANGLKNQGCDVIALACTGFSTIGAARKIGIEVGIPVVDPILAAGSIIANLIFCREDQYDGC